MASNSKPRLRSNPPQPTAVYLIQRRDRRRFKLGTSLEPLNRARMLPESQANALDLYSSLALWLPNRKRAAEVERGMHKCLAPYSISPGHRGDGYSEWFSPAGFLTAIRMLQQMPRDEDGAGKMGLCPLIQGGAVVIDRAYQSPQEVWWAIEDLLLRLANELPTSAYFDGEAWNVQLARFRTAWDGEMHELRPRVMDTDTFAWRTASEVGNFVPLTYYQVDTLVMRFAHRATMRSWPDGEAVDLQVSALMLRFGPPIDVRGETQHG